ncbi:MAG: hypothetical protein H7A37_00210 [Chlamydiales bacterium]|nr:hypothetical protein [Chlamydiia bacterium]MCP5506717.1 hypothetical protein [Chlamydiales bacterium]
MASEATINYLANAVNDGPIIRFDKYKKVFNENEYLRGYCYFKMMEIVINENLPVKMEQYKNIIPRWYEQLEGKDKELYREEIDIHIAKIFEQKLLAKL